MKIENLEGVSDQCLYEAFMSAFSDYEIKIDMPFEKFRSITYAKDFSHELSAGSFDGDELTGFVLVGFREEAGERIVYDIATGVTAGHRNEGIGSQLIGHLLESLEAKRISKFYLEVLENNDSAKHLYEKYGFQVNRRLACYEGGADSVPEGTDAVFTVGGDPTVLRDVDPVIYHSYKPTWQNALETWHNCAAEHEFISLKDGDRTAAYGIIHRSSGSVLQFGVHPDYRGTDAAGQLLSRLAGRTEAEVLRFINIEEGAWLCGFLENEGFTNSVNQFEMIYDIHLS